MSSSILIIEDEPNLGHTLRDYLLNKDYDVQLASSVSEGRNSIKYKAPEIILMDINLPDGNGVDFAEEVLSSSPDTAIIFLSAQNDPQIRLKGFELGALDYLTKPFELKELNLRLNRISASPKKENQKIFNFNDVEINLNEYCVRHPGKTEFTFGQKEHGILRLLIERKNQVVPREDIINDVWGKDVFPSMRTVDNYIVKLRKILDPSDEQSIVIESVRSVGYKLNIKEK